MKYGILTAVMLATSGVFAPAAAQNPAPLLGKWSIEYERGRRIENDVVTPVRGNGTLTVAQQGDSLTATLESGPRPDGTASTPVTMRGAMTAAGGVFLQKRQITVNENGEMSQREIVLTWTLQASGDALNGSIKTDMHGDMSIEPTPVTGTRAKP